MSNSFEIGRKPQKSFTFAKMPRNFDPRKMNPLASRMWKKGITN